MDALTSALAAFALTSLGQTTDDGHSIVLIGPDEPAFWPVFIQSAEYNDGAPDPLDRWSRRVLTQIATDLGAEPVFPFGGPPFEPFYTWALRSGRFWASPIGFLVHDDAGLFVSFRGALRFPGVGAQDISASPCQACAQPCATACPVDAFHNGYDVAACKAHLRTPEGADCMALGCRARRACPVGQGKRHPAQAAFHMKAFL